MIGYWAPCWWYIYGSCPSMCDICLYTLQLVYLVSIQQWLDVENNFKISWLFSSTLEYIDLFPQPSSYKDELGKNILYVVVVMTFLKTDGRIFSFGKKNMSLHIV